MSHRCNWGNEMILVIRINFDINGANVSSQPSISLLPTLVADSMEKLLPAVMVKGRANYFTSKREMNLMSRTERRQYDENAPYTIVKGYTDNESKKFLYQQTILFEPWMKNARLDIMEDLCGCGNPPRYLTVSQLVNKVQLEQIVLPYEPTPYLTYVQSTVEAIKKRELTEEAFLDFVVSKTDIRPDYMNNPRELKNITNMVAEVRNDPDVTIKGISVVGYASPDGPLKFNQDLSEGRANALVDYLLSHLYYPKKMCSIEFGDENWKGLLDVVVNSEMKYKGEVLSILNDKTISDEPLKTQLKRLKDGEPYQYMLQKYHPSLRKAICKIDYEEKSFDVVETKKIFKTHPQNLSLNEMFFVANTYREGSQEFIDVFETAVRVFPFDDTANLNAAATALSRKDTVNAERYLSQLKTPSAQYDNAMGVLQMLLGEYDKARELFIEAQKKIGCRDKESHRTESQG